jgi:signal transduction histidine kinase
MQIAAFVPFNPDMPPFSSDLAIAMLSSQTFPGYLRRTVSAGYISREATLMGLHRRSIRLRILLLVLIPILSLIGLYAFAVSITARDAINLARSKTVKNTIGLPTGRLEAQIDAERLLAVVYLANPSQQSLAALTGQELATNKARSAFAAAVSSAAATGSASPQAKQAFAGLLKDMAGLPALRDQITNLAISRPQAMNSYSSLIAGTGAVLNQLLLQQTSVPLVTQGIAFVSMGKSEEMLLQEDALLMGDMAARTFGAAGRQQFAELVGARRAIYAQTLPDLDPVYRGYYQKDVSPQASAALAKLENTVINDPRPRSVPPVSPASWTSAVGAVSAGLSRAGDQSANELTLRAQPVANSTYLRLFLAGGLGLLAIIASIVMSVWIGRGLVRQLAGLRQSALELAHHRLPSLVERLRAGQDVDVSVEAPQLETSSDEIGQVREAFNAVQRTAVEAAVDEARLRRGISDVFRNLARRSQSLLHRQLALLDAMERRATEPGELEDLFRIDHLTTRMRRHSEGLIILSGESPGRGWRNPVPLADVLRAAVAEVEDYTRIRVTTGTRAALVGTAVTDVIHLIAELAENATIFSPPNTPVRIHGDIVGRGFAVDIEDRGLGIPEEKLAEINHNLAHPPPFDLSGSDQLGLFVAGQLAKRHQIQISLRPSPYGGTTAIVLIPLALIVDDGDYELEPGSAAERASRLPGRHAVLRQEIGAEPAVLEQPSALTSLAGRAAGPAAAAANGTADRWPTAAAAPPVTLSSDPPAVLPADPPAMLPADPPAVLSSDPPAVLSSDPPAVLSSDPPAVLPADPPAVLSSDPPAVLSSDPPAVLSSDPPAVLPGERPAALATGQLGVTAAGPTVGEPTLDEPTLDEPTLDEPTLDEPTLDVPPPADQWSADHWSADPWSADPSDASPAGASPSGASPSGASPSGPSPSGPSPSGTSPAGAGPAGAGPLPADSSAALAAAASSGSAFDPWVIPARRTAGSAAVPGRAFVETTRTAPAAATGRSSALGRDQAPAETGGADDAHVTTTDLTELGLPVRVRQASLAPQLRTSGVASGGAAGGAAGGTAGNGPSTPSPEAARSTVSALQRGWERGRTEPGTQAAGPETPPSPEPRDAADTERSDE